MYLISIFYGKYQFDLFFLLVSFWFLFRKFDAMKFYITTNVRKVSRVSSRFF